MIGQNAFGGMGQAASGMFGGGAPAQPQMQNPFTQAVGGGMGGMFGGPQQGGTPQFGVMGLGSFGGPTGGMVGMGQQPGMPAYAQDYMKNLMVAGQQAPQSPTPPYMPPNVQQQQMAQQAAQQQALQQAMQRQYAQPGQDYRTMSPQQMDQMRGLGQQMDAYMQTSPAMKQMQDLQAKIQGGQITPQAGMAQGEALNAQLRDYQQNAPMMSQIKALQQAQAMQQGQVGLGQAPQSLEQQQALQQAQFAQAQALPEQQRAMFAAQFQQLNNAMQGQPNFAQPNFAKPYGQQMGSMAQQAAQQQALQQAMQSAGQIQQTPLGLAALLGGQPRPAPAMAPNPGRPFQPPQQVAPRPAPASVRPSPAPSQVPPRTPPAVANAIRGLAAKNPMGIR